MLLLKNPYWIIIFDCIFAFLYQAPSYQKTINRISFYETLLLRWKKIPVTILS